MRTLSLWALSRLRLLPAALIVFMSIGLLVEKRISLAAGAAHNASIIQQLHPSIDPAMDWNPNGRWIESRSLHKAHQVDPLDGRVSMRGRGSVRIGNNTMHMSGQRPRLYISTATDFNESSWNNVEFTAYARLVTDGDNDDKTPAYPHLANESTMLVSSINSSSNETVFKKPYSGVTLVTRSMHDRYKENPCSAHGYYARIWFNTGEVGVQKEFFHDRNGTTLYTDSIRAPNVHLNRSEFVDRFIGIKFVVRTRPDRTSVKLQVYLDTTTEGADGGNWTRVLDVDDIDWSSPKMASSDEYFPCRYPYAIGSHHSSPVLRPGSVSFLRSDGVRDLVWKHVSIREIMPLPPANTSGTLVPAPAIVANNNHTNNSTATSYTDSMAPLDTLVMTDDDGESLLSEKIPSSAASISSSEQSA